MTLIKHILNYRAKFLTDQKGMSLVEIIISISLLSLFFTTYAGFVEISSRFNNKENSDCSFSKRSAKFPIAAV